MFYQNKFKTFNECTIIVYLDIFGNMNKNFDGKTIIFFKIEKNNPFKY